jgi:hypothetical protein
VKQKRYVRRGATYKRAKTQTLIPGEPPYVVKPGTFPDCSLASDGVKGKPSPVDEGLRRILER